MTGRETELRLLWIDDEIDLLRPFIYGLRERGYEVETATNGPDGLDSLEGGHFDLVLLDQVMAGMTGLEVLRRIKEIDPGVLVTMVTKSDEEVLIDDAYGDMVDDFLIKPFTPPQLLAVLKRLLDKRRLIADRIGRQYLEAINSAPRPADWSDWVTYYAMLTRWQGKLGSYGDPALRDMQDDRWREANEGFVRMVEQQYTGWLEGDGPILSHRVLGEFARPLWEQGPTCFVLLDAMRADQWLSIEPLLREFFRIDSSYYYSILPTATPYSRNAIFSGLLPLDILRRHARYWVFEESGQNRHEHELLGEHLKRVGFKGRFAYHKVATADEIERVGRLLLDREIRLNVLVVNFLDLLIHSTRMTRVLDEVLRDDAALVGLTRLWFASSPLFGILKTLARRGWNVVITSDHGFLRVRRPVVIHGGRRMSANLRYKHGGAIRLDERKALLIRDPAAYMLPVDHESSSFAIAKSDYYFIYPTKPREYKRAYKHTYQHGGISLREMIVPVAQMMPR